MPKFIAFLRGVNVGGRIIKMAELKTAFETAGFKKVSTFLQTGNVTFDSHLKESLLKAKIERMLAKAFRYPAKVQVVSFENLAKIVAANPFSEASSDYHQYVIFIENQLEIALVAEAGKLLGEELKIGQGVVYWKVKKGQTLKSPFAKLLTKTKYKDFNTNRNINTLQKIIKSS